MSSLTSGALPALHFGASPHEIGSPIWQVLELKPTNNNQFARCVVSDGDYYYQAMFPSQQSALVKEGKVIDGSIIQVTEFTFQDIKGKRLIFLLQLEVLQLQCERIGNPQPIDRCTLDREKCLAAFNSAALSSSAAAMAVESKAPLLMPIDNQNTFSSSPQQQHHQQSSAAFNQSAGGNGGFNSSFNRPSNNSFASSSSFQSSAPSYMRTDNNNNNNNNNLSHRTPSSTTTSSISAGNYSGYYSHQPIPSDSEIYPISSLTPFQTKWTLKVRIQLKSDLKTYNQPKTGGQGKLYNMDLIDRYGESIRCTAFGTTAEKLYPMFEQGHTYIISNAKHNNMTGERESSKSSVRLANAKFKKGKNDYEIFLGNDLEVWHILDDHSIEGQKFYFKELASIQNIHLNNNNNNNNNGINSSQGQHYNNNAPSSSFVRSDDTMDVAGVVVQVGPLQEFTSKNDKHLKKRVIQIVDSSRAKVEVTLWGDDAEKKYTEETLNNYPIIAIKNARLTEFQNAKSLSVSFQSQIQLNPTIPAIIQLKQWWDNDGKSSYDSFDNLSKRDSSMMNLGGGEKKLNERKYLSDIIDLGRGDKPDYFTSRVVLSFIKHSDDRLPWYFACPNKKPNNNNNNKGENKCGKKVTQPDAGDYFCDSCSLQFTRPDVRYIVSIVAIDCTGSQWFTAFDDAAKILIGKSAAELQDLINNQDRDTVLRIFQEALFKRYIFRASASLDNSQQGGDGMQRIRYRLMEAKPFNYIEESKLLIDEINKYEQILGIN